MNEIEFRDAVLDEIENCPLLPFFHWLNSPGKNAWELHSQRWSNQAGQEASLDATKRLTRKYLFAALRSDLYAASDPDNFSVMDRCPGYRIIGGPDRTENVVGAIIDHAPLRFNNPGEFISPFTTDDMRAKYNPEWGNAKNEVLLYAPEFTIFKSTIRANCKIKAELRQGDGGSSYVALQLRLPAHVTEQVWNKVIAR